MLKIFIIVFFFFGISCQAQPGKKYFICDTLKEGASPSRSFDGKQNYFDALIDYEKDSQGNYKVSWPGGYGNQKLGLQLKDNILSEAFLNLAREQRDAYFEVFYRESFHVLRFHLDTQILIHSYVYYVSKKDYNKNFNEPLFTSKYDPSLFKFVSKKAPKGYVKIAWDKSRWKCYEISFWKYQYFSFGLGLLF